MREDDTPAAADATPGTAQSTAAPAQPAAEPRPAAVNPTNVTKATETPGPPPPDLRRYEADRSPRPNGGGFVVSGHRPLSRCPALGPRPSTRTEQSGRNSPDGAARTAGRAAPGQAGRDVREPAAAADPAPGTSRPAGLGTAAGLVRPADARLLHPAAARPGRRPPAAELGALRRGTDPADRAAAGPDRRQHARHRPPSRRLAGLPDLLLADRLRRHLLRPGRPSGRVPRAGDPPGRAVLHGRHDGDHRLRRHHRGGSGAAAGGAPADRLQLRLPGGGGRRPEPDRPLRDGGPRPPLRGRPRPPPGHRLAHGHGGRPGPGLGQGRRSRGLLRGRKHHEDGGGHGSGGHKGG